MSRPVAVICTLVAGVLAAIQPSVNASLAGHVGDLGAAFVSLVFASLIIGVLLVVLGETGRLSGIGSIEPEHAIGGIGGATIVVVSLVAARPLGVGALIALLVAAQVVVSVIADRYGWFGAHQIGISAGRIVGVVLVIAGTVLVTRT
ncbi:MAG: DMT family transporter [Actinomycetota bacterium]|nr:DMT family transporter [Actinomycetota bacterium]